MTADNDWDVFSGHGVYTVHYSGIHKRARSSAEYTRLYWKRSLSRKQRTSHSAGPRSTINISGDGSREQATGERAESNEKWFLAQQQTTTATTTQITTTTTTTKTTRRQQPRKTTTSTKLIYLVDVVVFRRCCRLVVFVEGNNNNNNNDNADYDNHDDNNDGANYDDDNNEDEVNDMAKRQKNDDNNNNEDNGVVITLRRQRRRQRRLRQQRAWCDALVGCNGCCCCSYGHRCYACVTSSNEYVTINLASVAAEPSNGGVAWKWYDSSRRVCH